MKKNSSFREKFRYWFDRLMGKGTIALVGMLFLVTAVVVIAAGIFGSISGGRDKVSVGNSIWVSLMHAIDAGTLAGDSTNNIVFIIIMSIVTLCGIFVTSILIGIISSGFEDKLNSLRKGFSVVVEENHTVIIGFNEGVYTMLKELIEANSNQKRACILIIGYQDKEWMDEEIRNNIEDFKTTEIICRSGNFTNDSLLEMASIETARAIIINLEDDFKVIKALLATVSYLKKKDAFSNEAPIVTLIREEENLEAAKIAGEGKAEVLFLSNILARIIAHTCRQPGMSHVLTEFFDFDGDEFYYEEFPELTGHTFGEILNWFEQAVVFGIQRDGKPWMNPPMEVEIQEGDKIILLAEDDGVSNPKEVTPKLQMEQEMEKAIDKQPFHLLILGCNSSLPLILKELNEYVAPGSCALLASSAATSEIEMESDLSNISFYMAQCDIYRKSVLKDLLEKGVKNGIKDVLILNEDEEDTEEEDMKTMLLLLQLRDISSKMGIQLNITTEMKEVENQKLCKVAKVNDFVIGTTIASLLITQISENRHLLPLFEDLLDADGSEIYMKPITSYIKPGQPVNMYTLTEISKKRGEIFVGYRKKRDARYTIVTNPKKDEMVVFGVDDNLIVVAED